MKYFTILLILFYSSLIQAEFGEIVTCSKPLESTSIDPSVPCRKGMNDQVQRFDAENKQVMIDDQGVVSFIKFDVETARGNIDVYPDTELKDIIFHQGIKKWILFQDMNHSSGADTIYLLDEGFTPKSITTSILLPRNHNRKVKSIVFYGSEMLIELHDGGQYRVDTSLPSLEQLKREAFEFYDIQLAPGWTFFKKGLGKFPSYEKVKAIYQKCESISKSRKQKRCFKKENKKLEKSLLAYAEKHLSDRETLIEYLKDKRINVTGELLQKYKELRTSEVFDLNYNWKKSFVGNNFYNFFNRPMSHQYTFNLSDGRRYWSIGNVYYLPGRFSVRYAYYPIGPINWMEMPH